MKDQENQLRKNKLKLKLDFMRTYRRHAMVITLILSAIITPPDITSQILVSFPLIILYEISIQISKAIVKKNNL